MFVVYFNGSICMEGQKKWTQYVRTVSREWNNDFFEAEVCPAIGNTIVPSYE